MNGLQSYLSEVLQLLSLPWVIKMVKSPKTGAYIFDEQMVQNDKVQDFFKK